MKINIQKLQGGGHLVTYNPLPILPQSTPAPQMQEEDKVIKDDLLEKMIGEGITSDVMVYASQINSEYSKYNALPNAVKNSPEGQLIRQKMKGEWAKLNALKRSRKRFDETLTNKKDALPEIAVYQGKVIAQDLSSGEVSTMSIADYATELKQPERRYRAITNSQLAYLREQDNRFAGRDDLIGILENSVSTNDVVKEIRGVLNNLGSIAKGDTDVSYEQKQLGDAANTLLNIKTTEGSYIESNRENLKAAASAMWTNLSDNSKDLLRAKAAQYGYGPEQIEEGAIHLAVSLLDPSLKEIIKSNEGLTPGGKGSGSGADTKGRQGIYMAASRDDLPLESVSINLGGSKTLNLRGYRIDNLSTADGKPRGKTFFSDIPEINYIADTTNGVYIGDQRVDPNSYQGLLWNGNTSYIVRVPLKSNGQPNINLVKNLEDAEKEIKRIDPKTLTLNLKKEIYYKHDIDDLDENGDPVEGRTYKRFLVFMGQINEKLIDNPNSVSLHKVSGPGEVTYKQKYLTDEKGKYVKRDEFNWALDSSIDVMEGPVFVPIKIGAPVGAQYLEQGYMKVPEKYNVSSTYDFVGPLGKQDPKGGIVTKPINTSFNSLNKKQ